MTEFRFDAVMFDCDGTLVDSEPITTAVLGDMLAKIGWPITRGEMEEFFIGRSVRDQVALIESRIGKRVTSDWFAAYRKLRNAELTRLVTAVPGAISTVEHFACVSHAKLAVVSASDRSKVRLQLEKVGLVHWFGDNLFSGHDVARNKPHPDVYLKAAASMEVRISRCAVVEDSVSGVTAGATAGATVFAYLPGSEDRKTVAALRDAGAVAVFDDMHKFPALLMSWSSPNCEATTPCEAA